MPVPVKPCEGRFSDDLQELLTRNRAREQWALHACQVCGTLAGAVQVQGKWVPEQHWPTVTYPSRVTVKNRYDRSGPRAESQSSTGRPLDRPQSDDFRNSGSL